MCEWVDWRKRFKKLFLRTVDLREATPASPPSATESPVLTAIVTASASDGDGGDVGKRL